MKSLRIVLVLPMAGIAGGVKVVFEYANRLAARGHDVTVLYPRYLFPKRSGLAWRIEATGREVKYGLDAARGISEGDWFPLRVPLLRTPSLESRYFPDADVVVATANETAEWVGRLPERCGSKFYFIQGYEVWSRSKEAVEATYRLPLKNIVISDYLRGVVERCGGTVFGQVPNSVNTEKFYPDRSKSDDSFIILTLYHPDNLKRTVDACRAAELVRTRYPKTKLILFGASRPVASLPVGSEFHFMPSEQELRRLYSNADVFLSASLEEGWGLTPMEAMACGCAVVATNVGGIPEYSIAGETALIVEPGDYAAMAAHILLLLESPEFKKKIGSAGYRYIQRFSIDGSVDKLETLLEAGL